jgi:5-formaminoimidazole-4-carboxamide-1-beta-D-ribofuranosyl 5'-monophosphate synthetase
MYAGLDEIVAEALQYVCFDLAGRINGGNKIREYAVKIRSSQC